MGAELLGASCKSCDWQYIGGEEAAGGEGLNLSISPLTLLQLYRAYSTLHFALWFALLVVVDALLLTPLNAVLRPLPAGHVVPPAFSPRSPPPFKQRPVTACVCWLASALPGRLTPEWVAAWSEWSGVGSGGEWGEARAPDHAVDSRCPCPALNVSAPPFRR